MNFSVRILSALGRIWRDPLQRACLIACVFTLGVWILMMGPPEFTNAAVAPKTGSPILDLQLVETTEQVRLILGDLPSTNRETMRLKTYQDFAYIPSYAAMFITAGLLIVRRGRSNPHADSWIPFAGYVTATAGTVAAIADVFENLAVLALLNTSVADTTQSMLDAIRQPAVVKWALVAIALLSGALAVAFSRAASPAEEPKP